MTASRRLIVTTDVEGYTRRDDRDADDVQRRLTAVLTAAYDRADFDVTTHVERRLGADLPSQPAGDATIELLPPGIDEARTVGRFVLGLLDELWADNRHRTEAGRMRLRCAIGQGVADAPGANGFGGNDVSAVCRLVSGAAVKDALRTDRRGDLVLVLDDDVHRSALGGRPHGLQRERFTRVTIDDDGVARRAWLCMPRAGAPTDSSQPDPALPRAGSSIFPDGPIPRATGPFGPR